MRASHTGLVALAVGAVSVVCLSLPAPFLDIERFSYPKELALHLTACVVAGAAFLAQRRQPTVRLARVDILLAGWLVVTIASTVSTFFSPQNEWLALRALGVTASSSALFWSACALARGGVRPALLTIVAAATLLTATVVLLESYGVIDPGSLPGRGPGGTLGVRNYAAHLVALGLPSVALLAYLHREQRAVLFACVVIVAASAGAITLTRSRAAWLAMLIGLAVCVALIARLRSSISSLERSTVVVGGGLAGAAILGTTLAVAAPNALTWRAESPYRETLSHLLEYRAGTGHTRVEQHARALDTLAAHPLLGVGPGNWTTTYARVARADDSTHKPGTAWQVPAYPASDWVAVATERGALGLLTLLLLGALLLVEQLRSENRRPHPALATHGAVTLAVLFVVCSLDAVLQMAAPALVAALALAASRSPPHDGLELSSHRGTRVATGLCALVALSAAAGFSARYVYAGVQVAQARDVNDLDALSAAAPLLPGHARIHAYLAHRFAQRGDCEVALRYAETALEHDETFALAKRVRERCGEGTASDDDERVAVTRRIAHSSQLWSGVEFGASGRTMAFATEHGVPGLFVASMIGEPEPRRLAAGSAWSKVLTLSPDDRWLVAESKPVVHTPGASGRIPSLHLYDVKLGAGSELVRGSRTSEEVSDPAFAPDGRRVAYRRAWREGEAWRFSLNVIDARTRDDSVLLAMPSDGVVRAPTWLPDGEHIAFVCSPDVCLVDADGENLRRLTALPEGSRAGHRDLTPDRPEVSPDGAQVAFAAQVPGDCFRLHVIDVETGEARTPFPDECAILPRWSADGRELVYVRLVGDSRTLWRRALDGGAARRVGLAGGMTYAHGLSVDGDVLFHGAPPDTPSGIWRSAPEAAAPELLVTAIDPPLPSGWTVRPRRDTVATATGEAAVEIFAGVCRDGRANTALVWLHPRYDFRPHSWKQEIQFLAASGITVLAVDYTPVPERHGAPSGDEREEMLEDVHAALRHAQELPGVAAERVFLLHISDVADIGYEAIGQGAQVRGLVDWVGVLTDVPVVELAERLPPTLFVNGKYDVVSPLRRATAERLKALGVSIAQLEYMGDHLVLEGPQRARALEAVRWFVNELAGDERCSLQ
jgi:Tol biopolymer transport system component/O-antigen ligase/acetyl esterase/lipase